MKFLLHLPSDSIIVEGANIEEVRCRAHAELDRRGIPHESAWAEQVCV